jgi:2-hydroxychromene-2-carboxylate isomerase
MGRPFARVLSISRASLTPPAACRSGNGIPPAQAYRFIEMQRWKDKRAIPLTYKPAFFPTPPGLSDCCAVALAENGGPALDFTAAAFKAVWVEDRNVADEAVLSEILSGLGQDASPCSAGREIGGSCRQIQAKPGRCH